MDFDFKKAREHKQKQDKARSTHRPHPNQKSKTPANNTIQRPTNDATGAKGHATPLLNTGKPSSYTETNPMQFQHLKRETEEIEALTKPKSYSRRTVVSNWERYELPPDIVEEETEKAHDFDTIVKSLSDVRGHLKLKHEQSWGNERSEFQEEFFNIDMRKLCASIERVPYHIRQGLPATMFTEEQLAVFEQDADYSPIASTHACLTTKTDDKKPTDSAACVKSVVAVESKSKSESKSENHPENQPIRETASTITLEEKSAESIEPTNLAEKIPPKVTSTMSDELDLDYLLSLDSVVVEKPKVPQQVDTLAMAAATSSKVPEAGKYDDWLDDLLDD